MLSTQDRLLRNLPTLGSQRRKRDVMFHAKLKTDDDTCIGYICEGSLRCDGFYVRVWILGDVRIWQTVRLSEISSAFAGGRPITLERGFRRTTYNKLLRSLRETACLKSAAP
jgi:hypothetical protein